MGEDYCSESPGPVTSLGKGERSWDKVGLKLEVRGPGVWASWISWMFASSILLALLKRKVIAHRRICLLLCCGPRSPRTAGPPAIRAWRSKVQHGRSARACPATHQSAQAFEASASSMSIEGGKCSSPVAGPAPARWIFTGNTGDVADQTRPRRKSGGFVRKMMTSSNVSFA